MAMISALAAFAVHFWPAPEEKICGENVADAAGTILLLLVMNEESETTRVGACSAGVFAIALTFLVIEIKVPSHEFGAKNGLANCLIALWPSYLAVLSSFATILVIGSIIIGSLVFSEKTTTPFYTGMACCCFS